VGIIFIYSRIQSSGYSRIQSSDYHHHYLRCEARQACVNTTQKITTTISGVRLDRHVSNSTKTMCPMSKQCVQCQNNVSNVSNSTTSVGRT
jgi:hypothetical protein